MSIHEQTEKFRTDYIRQMCDVEMDIEKLLKCEDEEIMDAYRTIVLDKIWRASLTVGKFWVSTLEKAKELEEKIQKKEVSSVQSQLAEQLAITRELVDVLAGRSHQS